jgi:hypothetical protein
MNLSLKAIAPQSSKQKGERQNTPKMGDRYMVSTQQLRSQSDLDALALTLLQSPPSPQSSHQTSAPACR